MAKPPYIPTPAQIRQGMAKAQKKWSERDFENRIVDDHLREKSWHLPLVSKTVLEDRAGCSFSGD